MTHPESESSAPAAWRWWRGARVATMSAQPGSLAWGWLPQGDLLTHGARIAWVGPSSEADAALQQHLSAPERAALDPIDLHGLTVTPGLIDAHTHLVYGGHRAREFELRLQGATYEEIARAGGGIRSTVTATREASDEQLFESALARPLRRLGRATGSRRRADARSAGAQPRLVRRGWQRHRHLAAGRCPDVGVAGLVAEA